MTILFFLKPHYGRKGGGIRRYAKSSTGYEEETIVERRKKKSFEIEPAARTIIARPQVESLLGEVETRRRRKRRTNLELLLKVMLDDDD
mgnify:CR=1 FL=1|tara:strand:- start:828 stop:1094 length:267 start_codon:yes stop_codon:yes gene_type:complete